MILPKVRDPRFITVRRGGSLEDADHHLLAVWAADCAQHGARRVAIHAVGRDDPDLSTRRPGDLRDRRLRDMASHLISVRMA